MARALDSIIIRLDLPPIHCFMPVTPCQCVYLLWLMTVILSGSLQASTSTMQLWISQYHAIAEIDRSSLHQVLLFGDDNCLTVQLYNYTLYTTANYSITSFITFFALEGSF